MLRDVLTQQFKRTAFRGNDELVFCHAERGSAYRPEWFREALTAALTAAGVEVGRDLVRITTFATGR
jgi:hypothetical protein